MLPWVMERMISLVDLPRQLVDRLVGLRPPRDAATELEDDVIGDPSSFADAELSPGSPERSQAVENESMVRQTNEPRAS